MSERREALAVDERDQRSGEATGRLVDLPELAGARLVAGFVAVRGEVDPAAALATLAARGAQVVLPRVGVGSPRLTFHTVRGPQDLVAGPYGLREPGPACPQVSPEHLDVVITPGLVFDVCGGRVGYGGGYYDELLARLRPLGRTTFVGLAYDFQMLARCPVDVGDERVDLVVTDARVVRCVPALDGNGS